MEVIQQWQYLNKVHPKLLEDKVLENYSFIQDHILLYHNEKYYEIMGEIEHELKIKNSPFTK